MKTKIDKIKVWFPKTHKGLLFLKLKKSPADEGFANAGVLKVPTKASYV